MCVLPLRRIHTRGGQTYPYWVIKSSWCVLPRRRRARATTLAAHEPLLYAHPESTRVRASFSTAKGPAREVLQVGELPTPSPAPGEVRVRVAFSGANPSDVKARAGASGPTMQYPRVIPHSDGAGVIDAVGKDIGSGWIGRRVWIFNGQWDRAAGTAAEYIVLPASQVVVLPDSVSFEHGASIDRKSVVWERGWVSVDGG